MFGSVKKWLGIEGVKLELVLPESTSEKSGKVTGKIRFFSKNEQTVTSIKILMVEKYVRGRRSGKKIDEYQLGEIKLKKRVKVPAEQPVEIDFTLPFAMTKSEMDEIEDSSIILGGIAKTAKWIQGAKSEFRVEAYAKVSGVALDPFDRKAILVS